MPSVNKVILMGHLGKDPEAKFLPSGKAVTNFSLATSEKWKDKQTGQQQERTEWHRIVVFGKLAEICAEYLHKGSIVYVEGRIATEKWQDQQGIDRYTTKIYANQMQFVKTNQGESTQQPQRPQQPHNPPSQPQQQQGEFNDDIPF